MAEHYFITKNLGACKMPEIYQKELDKRDYKKSDIAVVKVPLSNAYLELQKVEDNKCYWNLVDVERRI